jgi:DNA-3-methyladenine glycosylase I
MLILEGAQAGLNWLTILKKRESYRAAFDQFDPETVARYDDAKVAGLLADPGIIRNRLKVGAAIANARAVLDVQQAFGSLDTYLWSFVGGQPIVNAWTELSQIPVQTPAAEAMSKALKKRGFRFVGPTICYAFMQACGMVNDHVMGCFRYEEVMRAEG